MITTEVLAYVGIFSLILGILSFAINLSAIFRPFYKHKLFIRYFSLGVFCGTFLGFLQGVNINVDLSLNLKSIVVAVFLIIILIVVLSYLFKSDISSRIDFLWMLFGLMIIFSFLLTVVSRETNDMKFTSDEIFLLIEGNIEKGNVDRSLELLNDIKSRIKEDDYRYDQIEKLERKIDSIINVE